MLSRRFTALISRISNRKLESGGGQNVIFLSDCETVRTVAARLTATLEIATGSVNIHVFDYLVRSNVSRELSVDVTFTTKS